MFKIPKKKEEMLKIQNSRKNSSNTKIQISFPETQQKIKKMNLDDIWRRLWNSNTWNSNSCRI